jgi:hypothetical protein
MSSDVNRSTPRAARCWRRELSHSIVVASTGNQPTSAPHSVDMFAIAMRESIDREATPSPENSTAALRTSSLLYRPHSVMITSLPVTPGRRAPSRTTCTVRGTDHQNVPVAQIAAASVRTTGVPTAPSAPYILEWESEATTKEPGTTYPCSHMIW